MIALAFLAAVEEACCPSPAAVLVQSVACSLIAPLLSGTSVGCHLLRPGAARELIAPRERQPRPSVARTMLWSDPMTPWTCQVFGSQLVTTFHSRTGMRLSAQIQSMLLPVRYCSSQ